MSLQVQPEARLEAIRLSALECTQCSLAEGRNQVVFGGGDPSAGLMLIGEAPGAAEDLQGEPFMGRSGELLWQLLADVGIAREMIYITNIVKCRPPENRDPKRVEIAACATWLDRQLQLIQPRVVCTLGNFATRRIRGDQTGIMSLRGRQEKRMLSGYPTTLYPLLHPAAALRSTRNLKFMREDIARLPQILSDPHAG